MAWQNILFETKEQHIGIITINRPKVLNALNIATMGELQEVITETLKDKNLRALIVTGAERSFVAGADISEFSSLNSFQAMEYAQRGQRILDGLASHPLPVIAMINGFALGGGCELALACDLRVASTKAVFGQPEVTLGIIPGYGGTQRLARLIGRGRAFELCVTGEKINAEEAYRLGIVNKLFSPDELPEKTLALARTISAQGPVAVKLIKQAFRGAPDLPLQDALDYEARLFGLVFDTQDKNEGAKAFLEKRKPQFKGN